MRLIAVSDEEYNISLPLTNTNGMWCGYAVGACLLAEYKFKLLFMSVACEYGDLFSTSRHTITRESSRALQGEQHSIVFAGYDTEYRAFIVA
jgi:hypothetical protein